MPQGYVKKLADKHHTSVGEAEKKWDKAKARTPKGKGYGYTTQIFRSMMGEKHKASIQARQRLRASLAMEASDDIQGPVKTQFCKTSIGHSNARDYDDWVRQNRNKCRLLRLGRYIVMLKGDGDVGVTFIYEDDGLKELIQTNPPGTDRWWKLSQERIKQIRDIIAALQGCHHPLLEAIKTEAAREIKLFQIINTKLRAKERLAASAHMEANLDPKDKKLARDLKKHSGDVDHVTDQLLQSDDDAVVEVAEDIKPAVKTIDKKTKVMEQL